MMTSRGMARRLMTVSALALMGGAALTATISAQAAAVSLSPAGGWSVNKVDQSANGVPYCALTRPYAKDMIFTLGKNLNDEYSLAVDFQEAKLDPDKPYKLTLQPGASQMRSFDLMPMTPRTMVIRLGWDESFFNALLASKALRIGVGEEDYNFAMPDIAKGQADLADCVSGLKSAAQAQKEPAAEEVAKADVLNADLGAAREGFSARKVVASAEEPRTASAPAQVVPAPEAKIERAEAVPAPVVKPLPSKNPAVALATAAAPVVKEKPKQAPESAAAPDMLREVSSLKAENERLAKALESERSKLEELYKTQDSNALSELQEKIRLLEQDKARLSAGDAVVAAAPAPAVVPVSSSADQEKLKSLEQQLSALKTENGDLKQQLEQIEPAAGNDALANKVATLEASLSKALADKAKLESDVAVLRREIDTPRKKPAEDQVAKQRIASLEEELEQARSDAEKAQAAAKSEADKVRQELAEVRQGIEKDGSETEKVLAQLQKDYVAKVSELASVRAQLSTAQEELGKARESDSEALSRLRKDMEAVQAALDEKTANASTLDAELKKLREELVQARSTSKESLTTAQQEQIETKQALSAKTTELEKLQVDAKAAQEKLLADLTAAQDKLAAAVEKTEAKTTQADQAMAALKKDVQDKDAQITTLQASLDKAKAQLVTAEEKIATAQDKAAEQAEVAVQGEKSQAQLQLVSQELETLKRDLAQAGVDSEDLRQQNRLIKAELDKAHNKLAQADSKAQQVDALKTEKREMQAELKQLRKQTQMAETKASEAEVELRKARASIALDTGRRRESEETAEALNAIEPTYGHDPEIEVVKANAPDFGLGDVSSLLSRAGVLVQGKVSLLSASGATPLIFGWKTDKLFGRAEVAKAQGSFQKQIDRHLDDAKGRCKGDFAALPSSQSKDMANYEVACVSSKGSTSASLVFFKNKGDFVAIAHETAPDNMDLAMDVRDQIARLR